MTEQGGSHHAPGYRFAMLVAAVAGHALQRVAEGMAKIQDLAQSRFTLVPAHNTGFDLHRSRDDVFERLSIAAKHGREICFQEGEEFRIGNDPVFDNLGQSAAVLPFRQRMQHIRIRKHAAGGIKSADKVLPLR